jgi:N4-gp56 family major capsid protein
MAVANTTGAASAQLRSYFNKRLLEYAVPNFKYAADALKSPLPQKMGSNSTITWFKWTSPASANVQTLTEGTTPTARTTLTLNTVTATLSQYGEIVQITDLMSAQELFSTIDQGVRSIGEDCALHLDTTVRNTIVSGGPLSGNIVYGGSATAAAQLTGAGGYMVAANLLDAATKLKVKNAPKINGYYHAILSPNQCRDLMAATGAGDWLDINKYVGNSPILEGEIGRAYGVRVIESTIPAYKSTSAAPYTSSTAAHSAASTVYTGIVYGREMYGIADLNSQSPYAPSIEIVTGADKTDILNQNTYVGWKAFFAAKVLDANFGAVIVSNALVAGE